MTDLLADAGYFNGSNCNFLEQRKLTGWISVFGKYKPETEGFPYNKEKDEYRCPMNKPLPFKGSRTNLNDCTQKLLGIIDGLQGLSHEIPMCAKYIMP